MNRFSSYNKNYVILGACSATVCTFLMSNKSHTSKFLVNAFILSFLRSSATAETAWIFSSKVWGRALAEDEAILVDEAEAVLVVVLFKCYLPVELLA